MNSRELQIFEYKAINKIYAMRKFAFLLTLALLLSGCKMDTSTSLGGLSIEDSELARISDGQILSVQDKTFVRGEDVNYILYNVGQFTKGEDGLCWLDMDLEILNMEGEVVFSKTEMLGENGKVALEGGFAGSPYATYSTTEEMPSGQFKFKLKIYDRLGKGKASVSTTFELK